MSTYYHFLLFSFFEVKKIFTIKTFFTLKIPVKEKLSYRSELLRKKSDATQFRSHKSNRKLYSDVIKYHSGALAGQFGPMQYTVLCCAMHKDTFFTKFHLLNILLVFQKLSNNSAKLALPLRLPKVMILIIFDV